jgi:hypothetical protein
VLVVPAAGSSPPAGCTVKPNLTECPFKMKPWYDAVNSELWLVSANPQFSKECGWPGSVAVINENHPDFKQWGCGAPVYVWAKNCLSGPQTVTFTKKIFLPGVPIALKASLRPYKSPLTSMSIEVNGHLLLSATHAVHKLDLRSKAHAFKFGENTIEISAKKGPSKPCNAGETDTGFLMELHAKFGADVVATIDAPNVNGTALFLQTVTVKNAGPSATGYSSVAFRVSTSRLKVFPFEPNAAVVITEGDLVQGKPLPGCKYFRTEGYSTFCTIDGLKPGESRTFGVRYIYDAPPTGNFYDEFTESWGGVGDTFDPKATNNGGGRKRGVCRQAKPPPCVKP